MAIKVDPSQSIPNQSSSDIEWMNWIDNLKAAYGKKTAKTLFAMAWQKRKSSLANTQQLRTYLRDQYGIAIASDGLLGPLTDATENILDSIGDLAKGGTTAVMVIGGLILLPVVVALFNIAKAPAESVGTVLKYAK